ncbi:hypothetical protein [Thiomicrorhabdus sp.]|uniref:hypothetical protein n=1 Tax=Thiomicrorhabdus sp. TaxID=2039724 RepID=UPI002AA6C6C2|nr:hypothetical protein [Thiomicrorhabdus sp.]
MATTDETFDPNDLESIDALLDEAELEAVSEVADEEVVPDDQLDDFDISDNAEDIKATEEDLLDSIDDLVATDDGEPEVIGVSEPVLQSKEVREPAVKSVEAEKSTDSKIDNTKDRSINDEILAKRDSASEAKNSKKMAADMDSIKKLIIIFGSILSVLAVVGIGIGVWSALSASSAGIDEETQTLIESIKVSSEHNGQSVKSAEKSVKSIEKKLDALAFQFEQLSADIGQVGGGVGKAAQNEVLDPLGLGNQNKPGSHASNAHMANQGAHGTTPMVNPAAVTAVTHTEAIKNTVSQDPALLSKVSSVNKKLITAQRRIDEVNRRVKKIQAQYDSLIHSVKTVEKQVLLEQAEKMAKEEKAKEAANKQRYQYSAPDGGMYDQSVTDSYP